MRFLRKRMSVRMRATLATTAVVAAALGVVSAVLGGVLAGNLQDSAEAEAVRRAAVAADVLVAQRRLAAVGERQLVVDPDVTVIRVDASSAPAPPGPVPTEAFTVATRPVQTADGELLVQARASLHPVAAALDTLRAVLLTGVPALLLLVAGLTWLAVGRALAPVSAIRRELADITATDLHRRVPVPPARDEVALLAETTNRTLDRLEEAVGRHRRLVADAAHELRSPLAVLRTRLEIAPAQPLTTEALTDVERIQRLTADLLLLARLDAGEPPEHAEVDLGQVVAEEGSRTRPRSDVRVRLAVAPGVVVHGCAEQLRRLVANLVDNAVRHAATGIEVRLRLDGGAAVLEVEDDGPGIPLEEQEAVFDRFTRLDEARARDAGGSGLGLAIARDIALAHGGDITLDDAPQGGLRAVVRMPR